MRIVKTDSGRQFNVRGLTRREVRDFSAGGINLYQITPGHAQEAQDGVLKLCVSEHDLSELDDMPNSVAVKVFRAAMDETFGSGDEEKNSPRSGAGSQTKSG